MRLAIASVGSSLGATSGSNSSKEGAGTSIDEIGKFVREIKGG